MLWSFIPQDTFTEFLASPGNAVTVGPQTQITGKASPSFVRSFELHYTVVTSDQCRQMVQFFYDRRGAFLPFDFVNPNDQRVYQVRFDPSMRAELFTPAYFLVEGLTLTVVRS